MSLIDIMLDEISNMTRDDKFVSNEDWRRFLEKHLKQSESKSIDDLIEKYKGIRNKLKTVELIGIQHLDRFISDLETLKQSEKVVDEKELEVLREKARKYDELCK